MRFHPLATLAFIVLLFNAERAKACDESELREGAQLCRKLCDQSHAALCDLLADAAKNNQVDNIRINFGGCINDTTLKFAFETCYIEKPPVGKNYELISKTFCKAFDSCNTVPPPPLLPHIINIDFNIQMHPAVDNKNIVIADFVLP